jgi:probable FeS assembly SUF system protein SufT
MNRYEEVELNRDCDAVQVPEGTRMTLEQGTAVVIMQQLGEAYTIQVPTLGGLYRIAGDDADALGKSQPRAVHEAAAALARDGRPITEELLREVLRDVYDPEIPVNIVDLGLIYELVVTPLSAGASEVRVRMTLTAPGCGMGQIISDDVKSRLERLPGIVRTDIEVVWEPPWGPHLISPAGRTKLGLE